MDIPRSGKMYFNCYERYIVITIDDKVITRKVLSYNDVSKECKIRYKNNIISVKYHY